MIDVISDLKSEAENIDLRNLFRFGITGFLGYLIYSGMLFLLTEYMGVYYLLSAVVGGEISLVFMFFIHENWTFTSNRLTGSLFERIITFHLISGIGGLLNLLLLWFFTEITGIYYLVSSFLALITAFLFNYFFNLYFTWNRRKN